MYVIETHLHTTPVSSCARFAPEEMMRFCKDAGYDTVFVSDHFAKHHFDKLLCATGQEKTNLLYASYLRAKEAGQALGMHVLFSPELSLCGNHYLLYNADLAFLNSREDFFEMSLEVFYQYAKSWGITIVQAHPFRDGKCTPQPDFVDGLEAVNSNPRHENYDEKVFAIAKEYGLPVSAGSDAHRTEDIGGAAMLSTFEIKTTEDYLKLLRSGEAQLQKWGERICSI